MKMNFDYFQIQKWMLQTVGAEKLDEKNGTICLVFMFPSWVMVLKLSKNVHILQVCADISKKSKSVKAIYIYTSERSQGTQWNFKILFVLFWYRFFVVDIFTNDLFWLFVSSLILNW